MWAKCFQDLPAGKREFCDHDPFVGHTRKMRRILVALLALAIAACALAQPYNPNLFGGLRYRLIGPFRGGRSVAVTGVPGQPEKFYFGAVGGGVWETDNAGRTWKPIFDRVPVASIGAIAVAPSDPNTIYVGTGEADMRSDIQQGNGMYKSTDGGKNWRHIGLTDTRQIGQVLVDPHDANVVYVAALGHQYGPNEERGVFKSTDGGQTWNEVLYKSPDVGAIDMAMDPTDSNVIFASLWSTRRPPWSVYPPSNGPGGGLFKSTDAGQTWSQIEGHGFPSFTGKIGIAISPADHNRIYTLVDTNDAKTGGVYRSDDGGATWTYTDGERRIWGRGWYFAGITADPKNPDEVYVMNTSSYRSTDGGKTFEAFKGAPGGDDYHHLWIYPDDPNRLALSSDQGTVISVDGGNTWSSWYNQPTAQLYHVAADNRFPYWVYGAQQDSGAIAVPSRTIHSGISAMDTRPIEVGGESDMVAPDPLHPGVLFGSNGVKESLATAWAQNINPSLSRTDEVWRDEWTHPIAVSPADPHLLYMAHQKIFRSADGGASWSVISPDLSRPHTPPPANLNKETLADDTGLSRKGLVYWIAPSPLRRDLVWAGTDDGLIWVTRDEGKHWLNVTPPGMSAWSKVGVIDASHFDTGTAYAAIDRHRIDDNRPFIYRTHDGGKHWVEIVHGIPPGQFVNVVREDPQRRGMLYAGTDTAVFISFDDGDHWQRFQLNMPAASIRDIVFHGNDVIVGTHGRSIYILDDASRLRQLTRYTGAKQAALFRPSATVLFQRAGLWGDGPNDEGTPLPPEEPQGQNPAWGAIIDYQISRANTPVVFTVKDSSGKVMRTFSSAEKPRPINRRQIDIPAYWFRPHLPPSAVPGTHRYAWNLRYHDDGGPVLPPGLYSITMSVNGKSYTQPLRIERDPRLPVTEAGLRKQFAMALQVDEEIKVVNDAQKRADDLMKSRGGSMSAAQVEKLKAVIGERESSTPDVGGTTATDVNSLRYIAGSLGALRGAITSAPSAPTPEYAQAFAHLKRKAALAISRLNSLEG